MAKKTDKPEWSKKGSDKGGAETEGKKHEAPVEEAAPAEEAEEEDGAEESDEGGWFCFLKSNLVRFESEDGQKELC